MPIDFLPDTKSEVSFTPDGGSGGIDFTPDTPVTSVEPSLLEQVKQGFKKGAELVRPLASIPGQVASKATELAGKGVLGVMNLPITLGIDKTHTPLTSENFLPNTDIMTDVIKNALFQPDKGSINPFSLKVQTSITPEWQQKLAHFLARGVKENITPENVGVAMATGGAASAAGARAIPALKAMGIGFGGEALRSGVERAQQGDTEGSILNSALAALMLGGSAAGVDSTYRNTSGLALGDIQDLGYSKVPEERQLIQGQVPKQLSSYTPSTLNLRQFSPSTINDLVAEQVRQLSVRSMSGEVPYVGQRPIDIGQNLVLPGEAQPTSLVTPELTTAPKKVPLSGQISFEGQEGIPSAMQAKEMVQAPATQMGEKRIETRNAGVSLPGDFERYQELTEDALRVIHAGTFPSKEALAEIEQIKDQYGGMPPRAPGQVEARKLRPAVKIGEKVYIGEQGATHADILKANGFDPKQYTHFNEARGFVSVDKPGEFLNRQQAQQLSGIPGTAKAGGLDSQDLLGATSETKVKPIEAEQVTPKQLASEKNVRNIEIEINNLESDLINAGYDIEYPSSGDTYITKAGEAVDMDTLHPSVENAVQRLAELKGERKFAVSEMKASQSQNQKPFDIHEYKLHVGVPLNLADFAKKAEDFFKTFRATSNNELSAQLLDGAETRAKNDARAMRNEFERANPTIPKDAIDSYENAQFKRLKGEYKKKWVTQLSIFRAPDSRPFLTDARVAPGDYKTIQIMEDVHVAIHPDYLPLMESLSKPSQIQDSRLGNFLLEVESGLKHSILAVDTFHMARVMFRLGTIMGTNSSWKRGLSLLEYNDKTLADMVKTGEITQSVADWSKQNRPLAQLLQHNGLNVGRISENMYGNWIDKIPGLGTKVVGPYRKWVFEKLSRGAMLEASFYQFEKVKASNPTWSDTQVARKVARDINVNFGNIQRQGFLKNPSLRDIAQITLLAPQWIEAGLRRDIMGTAQLGKAATGQGLGTLGKSVGVGILAGVFANQLVNLITRGKPTWENEEKDHKLDAFIPDVSNLLGGKKGEGFWISPLPENMAQYSEYRRQGKTPLETTSRMALNKLSPIARAGEIGFTGQDYSGRKLSDTERVKEATSALAPFPIPVSRLFSQTPGAAQRQLFSAGGIKLEPVGRKERLDFMTLNERLDKYKKDKVAKPPTYEGKERGAGTASVENVRRGKEIADELPKVDRNWLDSRNLLLSGYPNTIKYQGVNLPLSETESEKFASIVKDEYSKALEVIKKRYDKIPSERGQTAFFSDVMDDARGKARERMEKEVRKSSSTIELDRKRYKTPGLGK